MNLFRTIYDEWKLHTWYGKIGFVIFFPFGLLAGIYAGTMAWVFEVLERIDRNQRDL